MVPVIQLIGIGFGLLMMYFVFVSFRRKELGSSDLVIWLSLWGAFLLAVVFPGILQGVIGSLNVVRVLDLLMVASFMVAFAMLFRLYKGLRRLERKMDSLAESFAVSGLRNRRI
ncbi:MAG: DUF2304 family protein [archaeon]